jgi:hypothetical protein
MDSRRLARLLPVAVVLACTPAAAWTAKTRTRMLDEAVRLMPASLQLALERHRQELLRGMLDPLAGEGDPAHRPPWNAGQLDGELAARAEALVRAVEKPEPFEEIARRFGQLAHFVTDAGFPPGASGSEGASRLRHFSGFVESRLSKFPLVFYGHEEPNLYRGDFRAFALEAMRRARSEDRELARAYTAAGNPPDPAAFDDRSVPFAVGSLAYSRAVTDVVRAWLAAWAQANGDLGRTPYLKPHVKRRLRGGS